MHRHSGTCSYRSWRKLFPLRTRVAFISSVAHQVIFKDTVTRPVVMSSGLGFIEVTSESPRDIAREVLRLLNEAGETISVAESLTGGGIMQTLSSVEGAGGAFRGGVVSYATPIKEQLLNIDSDLIARHGVIHGDVAEQMAISARNITSFESPTSWGIGSTGVAGPSTQDGKPAGTVFIGIASPDESMSLGPYSFAGDRHRVCEATIIEALAQVRKMLLDRKNLGKEERPVDCGSGSTSLDNP